MKTSEECQLFHTSAINFPFLFCPCHGLSHTIKRIHLIVNDLSDHSCRDSYLREQLELHGVLRNQNRQTTGRKGRNTQSVSSPSTLGHPTPTSIPMPSVSPRLNTLGRLSPGSSHVPSSLPTPIRHAPDSSGISSSPNTAAATQRPSHSQLPKSTTSYQQSRTNKPSNINSFLQKPQQDSRDTALPLYSSGYLDPTPMSGDEGFTGTATEPHNDRYITGSAPAGSWSIAEQAALTEQATLVCNPTSNVEDSTFLP
jgi:hypothetical protein